MDQEQAIERAAGKGIHLWLRQMEGQRAHPWMNMHIRYAPHPEVPPAVVVFPEQLVTACFFDLSREMRSAIADVLVAQVALVAEHAFQANKMLRLLNEQHVRHQLAALHAWLTEGRLARR